MMKWVFGADSRPFKKGLDDMRNQTKSFTKSMGSMIAGAFAFGSVVAGIKTVITQMARVDDLAKRFGESAESIQRVGHAAELAGSNIEGVARAMTGATKNAYSAAQGSEEMVKAFENMGINAKEFMNMPMEGKMVALAKAMESGKGDGEKLAMVMKVLGKSGGEMMPLLNQGSEALSKQFAEIAVASNGSVAALATLDDKIADIKNTFLTMFADFIGPLQKFGHLIGGSMATFFAIIQSASKQLGHLGGVISAIASGDIVRMTSSISDLVRNSKQEFENLRENLKNIADDVVASNDKINESANYKGAFSGKEEAEIQGQIVDIASRKLAIEKEIADIKKKSAEEEEAIRQKGLTTEERLLELAKEKEKIKNDKLTKEFGQQDLTDFDYALNKEVITDEAKFAKLGAGMTEDDKKIAVIEAEEKSLKAKAGEESKKEIMNQAKKAGEAILEFAEKVKQLNDDIIELDKEKAAIIEGQAFEKMTDEEKVTSLMSKQKALNEEAAALGKKGDIKGQKEKEIEALGLNDDIKSLVDGEQKIEATAPTLAVSSLASIGAGGNANLLNTGGTEQRKVSLLEIIAQNTAKSETGGNKLPEPV